MTIAESFLPKRPATTDEFSGAIKAAGAAGMRVRVSGSDSLPLTRFDAGRAVQVVSTLRMNKLLEHAVGDMTVVVQAGMTLEALQRQLAWHNQWLTIDPPVRVGAMGRTPGQRTVGGLIATNSLGPLRFGCGDFRLLVMGMRWIDGKGTVLKAGGRTVKNSAGYASHRMMIGACGSLGAIAEVTLRTFARPADEQCVLFFCEDYGRAEELIGAVMEAAVTPAYIELIGGGSFGGNPLGLPGSKAVVVVGFLNRPHVCAGQIQAVRDLAAARGLEAIAQTAAQAGRLRLWMTSEPEGEVGFRMHGPSSEVCGLAEGIEELAGRAGLAGGKCWVVAEAGSGVLRGSVKAADGAGLWRELAALAGAHRATILATQGGVLEGTSTSARGMVERVKAELDPGEVFGWPPVNAANDQ